MALRESKKQETRQRISDVATKLFFTHGFDAVTVDKIAVVAKVSKMTVFNYFPRKEELILDRVDDLKLLPFQEALRTRPANQSPVDALRTLVQQMNDQKHPLCHVDSHTVRWWRVVDASPTLKAYLRELEHEATEGLAIALGGAKADGQVRLTAGVIVLTVRIAHVEAIRLLERGASTKKANAAFLALMERGLEAVERLFTAKE